METKTKSQPSQVPSNGQKHWHSVAEVFFNYASGYVIAWLTWMYIAAPIVGLETNVAETTEITTIFTVVSIIRSYLWRRLFNWIHINGYF